MLKAAPRLPLAGSLVTSPPPSDNTTVENLRAVCLDHAKLGENSLSPSLDSRFFGPSPSQVLYLIEVGRSDLLQELKAVVLDFMHLGCAVSSLSLQGHFISVQSHMRTHPEC